MRIAMWSGPRNLSTAMMYAFAARGDCAVVDEPFYAAYLAKNGLDHPMRTEILASQPTDPDRVITQITGSIAGEKPHFYQKHMAHHMLDGFDRGWMADVQNVFLIRHPVRVVASYSRKSDMPTIDDLGFRQQAELFEYVASLGTNPVVIDSGDIRANPRAALTALCDALGLDFNPAMLSWPAGGHADDGVWAHHWYASAHCSIGFSGPEDRLPILTTDQQLLVGKLMDYYLKLHKIRILQ